ncbi:uncharacterized protein sS8_4960 [Methylocaldum marinum]|uniref:Uncharacterized protein n=1 Tax=Methylocaldum marinum TaxID=1432792 RepID=A0A250KYX6_9GAMM|nr:uncharacterized protein sS8_4960 [Methylocaldum marinum]
METADGISMASSPEIVGFVGWVERSETHRSRVKQSQTHRLALPLTLTGAQDSPRAQPTGKAARPVVTARSWRSDRQQTFSDMRLTHPASDT